MIEKLSDIIASLDVYIIDHIRWTTHGNYFSFMLIAPLTALKYPLYLLIILLISTRMNLLKKPLIALYEIIGLVYLICFLREVVILRFFVFSAKNLATGVPYFSDLFFHSSAIFVASLFFIHTRYRKITALYISIIAVLAILLSLKITSMFMEYFEGNVIIPLLVLILGLIWSEIYYRKILFSAISARLGQSNLLVSISIAFFQFLSSLELPLSDGGYVLILLYSFANNMIYGKTKNLFYTIVIAVLSTLIYGAFVEAGGSP